MIETARPIFRSWREADIAPFHAMGRDPDAIRINGALLSEQDARDA